MNMTDNYLKTARVIVVDDQPAEAMPIIEALSQSGIGSIYLRGDRFEDLPEKPFKGIRLVFLDLRLGYGGEQKSVLSPTVEVLARIIEPETMPLVLICWTKYEDDIKEFTKMVVKDIPGLRPGFIKFMRKPFKDINLDKWSEPESLRRVVSHVILPIRQIIDNYPPLHILWDWEQVVHDSISQTTQTLADTVTEGFEKKEVNLRSSIGDVADDFRNHERGFEEAWLNDLLKVLRALVDAEAGKTVSHSNAREALFNVLNVLVSDRLSHAIFNKTIKYSNFLLPQKNEDISNFQRARLNKMLLVEPVRLDDVSVRPGNIYIPEKKLRENCIHAICKLDFNELAERMIKVSKSEPELQELKEKRGKFETDLRRNSDNKKLKDELARVKKKIEELPITILSRSKPILVEISPPCDFSQNKRPVAKLIAGILVPEKHSKSINAKADDSDSFMRKLAPMYLPGLDEVWLPVFNSRFQFGVATPEKTIKNKPLCRFRSQALVDIQVWAASRASRPGMLSIR